MKYSCKKCCYYTDRKSSFDRHLISNKHTTNNKIIDETAESIKLNYEKRLHDMEKEKFKEFEKLTKELLEEKDKIIKILSNVVDGANGYANQQLSVIKYLVKNHTDAPSLVCYNDFSKIKMGNENKFIKTIIYYYCSNRLVKYLSECIVKEYKKDNPQEQSMWTSDTSRLTYIIKELMKDNTSIWLMDKKGIKVKNYIIKPLLNYLKTEIVNYSSNIMYDKNINIEEQTMNIIKGIDLIKIIDNGALENSILKEIAHILPLNIKI